MAPDGTKVETSQPRISGPRMSADLARATSAAGSPSRTGSSPRTATPSPASSPSPPTYRPRGRRRRRRRPRSRSWIATARLLVVGLALAVVAIGADAGAARSTATRGVTRPSRFALAGFAVGLLVMVVALQIGDGAPRPSPAGIPDPGSLVGWALPAVTFLTQSRGRRRHRVPDRRGVPAADEQGRRRGAVGVRGLPGLALGGRLVGGQPRPVRAHRERRVRPAAHRPVASRWSPRWPSTPRSAGRSSSRRRRPRSWPWPAGGRSASGRWRSGSGWRWRRCCLSRSPATATSSGSHDLATTSLFLHVVGVCVWVGGLVALGLGGVARQQAPAGRDRPVLGPRAVGLRGRRRLRHRQRLGAARRLGRRVRHPRTAGWSSPRSSPCRPARVLGWWQRRRIVAQGEGSSRSPSASCC